MALTSHLPAVVDYIQSMLYCCTICFLMGEFHVFGRLMASSVAAKCSARLCKVDISPYNLSNSGAVGRTIVTRNRITETNIGMMDEVVMDQRRIRGFRAAGETMRVPYVSWELGSKVPPTKKNSADLPAIFRKWPNCVYKKKSNVRGQC